MATHDEVPGARREAGLRQGRIEYTEYGSGRAVVFVHGLFVNSALWRDVAPAVAAAASAASCLTGLSAPIGTPCPRTRRSTRLRSRPLSAVSSMSSIFATLCSWPMTPGAHTASWQSLKMHAG